MAACGASERTSPSPTTPTPLPTTAEPAPTTTSRDPTPRQQQPITISFAGDIHFEGQLATLLGNPESALEPISDQLSAADLTIVNLETSVGTNGRPEPGKRYTFQAPLTAFDALAAAGVDVVTMANNHAMDFGTAGLQDTLQAIGSEAPLDVVGVGETATKAFTPAMLHVSGTTIAVLGASMADDPTADPTAHWAATEAELGIAVAQQPRPLLRAVNEVRDRADVVVVYLHWGVQGERCPSASQSTMAEQLADAGADIVVGSHTHTIQGAGMLGETFVAYGLGNFLWYTPGPSGLLNVTVDNGPVTAAEWLPAEIGTSGLPRFGNASPTDDADDLRQCANLDAIDP